MENAAFMTMCPHMVYSARDVEGFRAWCLSWPSGLGPAAFEEWQRKGARMRERLKSGELFAETSE